MKAFILAAGEGKRLRPYTENLPKCKVSLAGKPLIERQIETLVKSGINDITLLTGYHSNELNYLKRSTLHNPYYNCTNMVFTLMYAMEDIADLDSVIISYGDIIYDIDIIEKLIKSDQDISVVIDNDWKKYWMSRFSNPLDDLETLKINEKGFIEEIGEKPKSFEEIQGQYIGLMKFRGNGIKNLVFHIQRIIGIKSKNDIISIENVLNKNYYMTDLIQDMIDTGNEVCPIFINGNWIEIDTVEDYQSIEKMYNNAQTVKENREFMISTNSRNSR